MRSLALLLTNFSSGDLAECENLLLLSRLCFLFVERNEMECEGSRICFCGVFLWGVKICRVLFVVSALILLVSFFFVKVLNYLCCSYKPNSYDGEALLFGRVTETYFPLFGSSALNRRYQNKLKLASKENPIKLFAKRLRARVAWSDEEDVQLLLWTRRHPQDVTFEEAEKRPLER